MEVHAPGSLASGSRFLAILDLDGVILELDENGLDRPDVAIEELVKPGAKEFIDGVVSRGGLCCVASNQPKIARGEMSAQHFVARMRQLLKLLPIESVFFCEHDEQAECYCRKPKPGLLLEALVRKGVDSTQAVFVGDRATDFGAARAASVAFVRFRSHPNFDEGFDSLPLSVDSVNNFEELMAWIVPLLIKE